MEAPTGRSEERSHPFCRQAASRSGIRAPRRRPRSRDKANCHVRSLRLWKFERLEELLGRSSRLGVAADGGDQEDGAVTHDERPRNEMPPPEPRARLADRLTAW